MKSSKDINRIIEEMQKGNRKAIVEAIESSSPILQLNGLMFASKYSVYEASEAVRKLDCKDNKFMGTPLSNFKTATMHLLDIAEYKGDEKQIKDMIKSKFGI